jgi:hypothetical protein
MADPWLMIVLTRPTGADTDDEYNEWYSGRHLDDVLVCTGVQSAQRYQYAGAPGTGPAQQYLAVYEIDGSQIEDYQQAMNDARASGRMPLSPALADDRTVWLFEPVGPRRIAPTLGADHE